ncbi:hypothetical protein BDZ89DRAFT_1151181 [Hymenopellis radicata]|nr:hypothetical protein BDZ89DRAFT_1151181 [Hymenopellis radicata]
MEGVYGGLGSVTSKSDPPTVAAQNAAGLFAVTDTPMYHILNGSPVPNTLRALLLSRQRRNAWTADVNISAIAMIAAFDDEALHKRQGEGHEDTGAVCAEPVPEGTDKAVVVLLYICGHSVPVRSVQGVCSVGHVFFKTQVDVLLRVALEQGAVPEDALVDKITATPHFLDMAITNAWSHCSLLDGPVGCPFHCLP